MVWLAVALGGAVGALMRFGVATAWPAGAAFPWPTLLVNVVGTAVLAGLTALTLDGRGLSEPWQLGLGTGLCGALTTFSTFSVETLRLVQAEQLGVAAVYTVTSVLLCLAVAGGTLWWVRA